MTTISVGGHNYLTPEGYTVFVRYKRSWRTLWIKRVVAVTFWHDETLLHATERVPRDGYDESTSFGRAWDEALRRVEQAVYDYKALRRVEQDVYDYEALRRVEQAVYGYEALRRVEQAEKLKTYTAALASMPVHVPREIPEHTKMFMRQTTLSRNGHDGIVRRPLHKPAYQSVYQPREATTLTPAQDARTEIDHAISYGLGYLVASSDPAPEVSCRRDDYISGGGGDFGGGGASGSWDSGSSSSSSDSSSSDSSSSDSSSSSSYD